jgi:hypothetical protein
MELRSYKKTLYHHISWKGILKFLRFETQTNIQKGTEKINDTLLCFFPPNSPSHTVNVYCCRLLITQTPSACHVQWLTEQHISCTNYCTNCTVCNWTALTVITHKLLLHVQLHNSTAHLLYKYCTNCTVYSWTVLTVITHELFPHVQRPTVQHIYGTNRTAYNWTVLTVIKHKLPLHVQLHNSTKIVQLMFSEVQWSRLFDTVLVSM